MRQNRKFYHDWVKSDLTALSESSLNSLITHKIASNQLSTKKTKLFVKGFNV